MAKTNQALKAIPAAGETAASVPVPQKAVGLDQLIHERVRLGIVSALAANEKLSFGDLKEVLGLTDGNLSIHARKLKKPNT